MREGRCWASRRAKGRASITPPGSPCPGGVFRAAKHGLPMDIRPASLDQVMTARDGRTIMVENDVGGLAVRLREIDPSLVLRWHEATGHWSVIQRYKDKLGRDQEQLVATCQPLRGGGPDPRMVDIVARVASAQHDPVKALDDAKKQRERAQRHAHLEDVGARLERAHFEYRTRENARQDRVFVP